MSSEVESLRDIFQQAGRRILLLHQKLSSYRLYHAYAWAIIPLLVITAQEVNAHANWQLSNGYDVFQHLANVNALRATGSLPPPPLRGKTYVAFHSPLFYVLILWASELGSILRGNALGFAGDASLVLMLASMAWGLSMIAVIQQAMSRAPGLLKAATLAVLMLLPLTIITSVTFNDDLPSNIFAFLAVTSMWHMTRSAREREQGMWLRAAALGGLGIAFKNNDIIVFGIYVALASYVILYHCWQQDYRSALKIARMAAIGLPLMIIPSTINGLHAATYFNGDVFGEATQPTPLSGRIPSAFFTTFDTHIFDMPFRWSGSDSFWSLQYVGIHGDYFYIWRSPTWDALPIANKTSIGNSSYILSNRYSDAVILQYLGIPVTLMMVFAVLAAGYRLLQRQRKAIRDGSLVVLFTALVTQFAIVARFSRYAVVTAGVIHARYTSFLYMFLIIAGVSGIWKLCSRRRKSFGAIAVVCISLVFVIYCAYSLRFMWLPTL